MRHFHVLCACAAPRKFRRCHKFRWLRFDGHTSYIGWRSISMPFLSEKNCQYYGMDSMLYNFALKNCWIETDRIPYRARAYSLVCTRTYNRARFFYIIFIMLLLPFHRHIFLFLFFFLLLLLYSIKKKSTELTFHNKKYVKTSCEKCIRA